MTVWLVMLAGVSRCAEDEEMNLWRGFLRTGVSRVC